MFNIAYGCVRRAGREPASLGFYVDTDMVAGLGAGLEIEFPVGALAEVLQRKATVTRSASHCAAASRQAAERPHASSIVYSLFAELRGYQAFDLDH